MKVIAISPGHYENYRGVSKNGYVEYDEVVKIVDQLKLKFDPSIYQIHVVEGKLLDKVTRINEINPDLAIEVHLGNTNNTKTDGSRAFFMMHKDSSKKLAENLLESCVRMLGSHNRGAWVGWFKKMSPSMVESNKFKVDFKPKIDLFLSKINAPSAIIEPYYISSIKDCDKYIANDKHDFVADAIYDGVIKYFNQ
ncbi:putative endolysin protein [Rhizobium phage RHph_TM40]|uniref:Putative endolysin protein n=2 Tax=Cuauhnahuacvirus TaxID=3044696 RepID=A0A7S5R8C6_9CAUD|nr:endolysin [Rhizobium phage RHph_TM30]YP_010671468.1 endolysin [Rhizobium phage RHph_Y65]QIG71791.1 putative endolysin protein [Rhizobium phage RHph_TM40]QIG72152.1 putative endolysin protein [Rhizobium phage RHph_TM2_3B]QIG72514.1 putative endolysin protein [Rhizobium phage RHph_TM3_3_6]QIG71427.1 putative endolysin protein [Rhizobium phage RHph_TM30]QIG72877.1 putative endolysin protein [Rhizobium phage RHph_Y65]